MTSGQFVVHGCLRGAAAGGSPRGQSYAADGGGRHPTRNGAMCCRPEATETKRCAVGQLLAMCCRFAVTPVGALPCHLSSVKTPSFGFRETIPKPRRTPVCCSITCRACLTEWGGCWRKWSSRERRCQSRALVGLTQLAW